VDGREGVAVCVEDVTGVQDGTSAFVGEIGRVRAIGEATPFGGSGGGDDGGAGGAGGGGGVDVAALGRTVEVRMMRCANDNAAEYGRLGACVYA